jgi:hypothetical protein
LRAARRRRLTTLGALRRQGSPTPSAGAAATPCRWTPGAGPEDDQAVVVVASWAYLGRGYQSTGEAWLAASAAARAREARRIAKEELRTLTMTAA